MPPGKQVGSTFANLENLEIRKGARFGKAVYGEAEKRADLYLTSLDNYDVKAIKVAAAQAEQTISEFMLACFHACMQTCK